MAVRLCECGCGRALPTRAQSRIRFVLGHHCRGARHYRWQEGRSVNRDGYVEFRGEKRISEHRQIVEHALGHRLPPGAEVHHFNGVPGDNRRGNLVACQDRAYHMLLHQRQRALEATGNARAVRCYICKTYDDSSRIYVYPGRPGGFHPECLRANRKRLALRKAAACR